MRRQATLIRWYTRSNHFGLERADQNRALVPFLPELSGLTEPPCLKCLGETVGDGHLGGNLVVQYRNWREMADLEKDPGSTLHVDGKGLSATPRIEVSNMEETWLQRALVDQQLQSSIRTRQRLVGITKQGSSSGARCGRGKPLFG